MREEGKRIGKRVFSDWLEIEIGSRMEKRNLINWKMFSSEETKVGEKCKTSALVRKILGKPINSHKLSLYPPQRTEKVSISNRILIFQRSFSSFVSVCKIVSWGEKKRLKHTWKKGENSGKLLNFCLSANPFDLSICWRKIYNCFGMWRKFYRRFGSRN